MNATTKSDERSKRTTMWKILEKVVIPFALVVLAASQAVVARQQVEVAKLQLDRQSAEATSNLQLKYVELFYHDIQDPDPRKQKTSIALLAAMQPEIARTMSRIILANPSSSKELREQVNAALTTAQRFGPLVNYRLVIYYPKSVVQEATNLRARLAADGFPGAVELRERASTFLDDATKFGYHIRYDDVYEQEAADYLMKLLPQYLPGRSFDRIKVVGRSSSDGTLTIFLFEKTVP